MVHLESGEHTTLTPVMKGGGYFTIPHVRMGYDQGVEIQLFEGEYTKKTMEPFSGYMGMWEKQKNSADEVIAKSKEALTVALERERTKRRRRGSVVKLRRPHSTGLRVNSLPTVFPAATTS